MFLKDNKKEKDMKRCVVERFVELTKYNKTIERFARGKIHL